MPRWPSLAGVGPQGGLREGEWEATGVKGLAQAFQICTHDFPGADLRSPVRAGGFYPVVSGKP